MRKRHNDVTQSGGYIHLSAKGAPTLKIPVESGDMAQQMWEAYRYRYELKASDMTGRCGEIRAHSGELVARVSYNGRLWNPEGQMIQDYDQPQRGRRKIAMTTFTINSDNAVTAFAEYEDALNHRVGATDAVFTSEKELATISADWPLARFGEVWNEFAGVVPFDDLKPVKKFTDRKTAVARIWRAIQALTPSPARHVAPVATKEAKAPKQASTPEATPTAREGSKKAIVLDLLRRPEGATLADIMSATGWLAHSVRGFISGAITKKMGLAVASTKREDGARVYRVS